MNGYVLRKVLNLINKKDTDWGAPCAQLYFVLIIIITNKGVNGFLISL